MIYIIYHRLLGHAMTDFVNYAAFHGTPIRTVELNMFDKFDDASLVYFYIDTPVLETAAEESHYRDVSNKIGMAGIPRLNGYKATQITRKDNLYSALKKFGYCAPEFCFNPQRNEQLAGLGKTVIMRSADYHNQSDIHVFHEPYENALPSTYLKGIPMAVQFIETYGVARPEVRMSYRIIVIGSNYLTRSVTAYTGYLPAGTKDMKTTLDARKEFCEEPVEGTYMEDHCHQMVEVCTELEIDVAAIDFLLPDGRRENPVITDVTLAYNSFRKEHLASPFLFELGIVEKHHAILLETLRARQAQTA